MKALTEKTFENLLRKFADDPDDVLVERDKIVFRANGENYAVHLHRDEDGVLFCREMEPESREMKVRPWILQRLANFKELAEKILQAIDEDPRFIPVASRFESLEGSEEGEDVEKTTEALFEQLRSPDMWSTRVFYLLSEAGDGKTCIMNRLARRVAQAYLDREVHFLFLPIGLDGRPFMRFDEVVIGVLAQKYRFRRLYYEAVMELVKWGFLVLGLDGFEEMTVEGKENKVISSLGTLLQQHEANGSLVISARRAFYEYALTSQGPLMNAIRDFDVDFSAFRLRAWTPREFIALMEKYGFSEGDSTRIHSQLATRLGSNHPIMTRPVLARKLVEMLEDAVTGETGECDRLIGQFSPDRDPQKVVQTFVEVLLKREATQKWIRFSGASDNVHQQLLTADEHEELMEELAEEMWLSRAEFLKEDILKSIVQLFCENKKKSPSDSQECTEKIVHHAMIVKTGITYAFCHDAFREYFLGSRIARLISSGESISLLNQLFAIDVLRGGIVDVVAYCLSATGQTFEEIQLIVDTVRQGCSRTTPINQNAAGILAALWCRLQPQNARFSNLYFAASTTREVPFRSVLFEHCSFENFCFTNNSLIRDVEFRNCSLLAVTTPQNVTTMKLATFDEPSRPGKLIVGEPDTHVEFYDPQSIMLEMSKRGCSFPWSEKTITDEPIQSSAEEKLFAAFDKLLRLFQRRTGVPGRILQKKHSSDWSEWTGEYLPAFLENGLIRKGPWHGSGQDVLYMLAVSPEHFDQAKRGCHGKFDVFCSLLKDPPK